MKMFHRLDLTPTLVEVEEIKEDALRLTAVRVRLGHDGHIVLGR
jgi:hypothetical protein